MAPRKVAPVLDVLALDFLDLGLDSVHCHNNCCHMANSALLVFGPGFAHGVPEKVYISGYPLNFLARRTRCVPRLFVP